VLPSCLEFWTMDKVHTLSSSKCSTPLESVSFCRKPVSTELVSYDLPPDKCPLCVCACVHTRAEASWGMEACVVWFGRQVDCHRKWKGIGMNWFALADMRSTDSSIWHV
jgi:hypothetical protein